MDTRFQVCDYGLKYYSYSKYYLIILFLIRLFKVFIILKYDIIIIDGSDPVGPAEGLFSVEFYTNCFNALKNGGILVAQGESPKFNEKAFRELNHTLQSIFGRENAPVSLFFVPTYPTGMWSFQYGLKNANHPKNIQGDAVIETFVNSKGLRYYNADVHRGSFATPNFVKSIIS